MLLNNLFLLILFNNIFCSFMLIFLNCKLKNLINLHILFSLFSLFSLVLSLLQVVYFTKDNIKIRFKILNSIEFENYVISFSFLIDSFTSIMLFMVIFISFCVNTFSIWYMKGDPCEIKFKIYLILFTLFMILLVSSDSFIIIFVGWEGIGIFSYLLINFWNSRLSANRSALKAVIINKFGDIFLYFFISLFFFLQFSFTQYDNLSLNNFNDSNVINFNSNIFYFMLLSLIFACFVKSAQFFFHVWLPDAMEGPTPVSALLHAATMVTAGAFIIMKNDWLIYLLKNYTVLFCFFGILTNFLSSLIALFVYDIKKIIAYSTASQIGFIFIVLSNSKTFLAYFHMYNHAFFKALLFIMAGVCIHLISNKQDLRFFYKINLYKTFIYISFLISCLTLAGTPFLSAYYSKEFVLQFSFVNINVSWFFINFFLHLSVTTTILYTLKLFYFLFFIFDNSNFKKITFIKITNKTKNSLPNKILLFIKNNLKFSVKLNYKVKIIIPLYIKFVCYVLIFFSIFNGFLYLIIFLNATFFYDISIYDLNIEKTKEILKNDFFSSFIVYNFFIFCFIFLIYKNSILKYNLIFSYVLNVFNFFSRKTLNENIDVFIVIYFNNLKNKSLILQEININFFLNFINYFKAQFNFLSSIFKLKNIVLLIYFLFLFYFKIILWNFICLFIIVYDDLVKFLDDKIKEWK